jgi:hypothetical protein
MKQKMTFIFNQKIPYSSCSHIRFRAEPFQILTLPVNKTATTLERIISQLTKIEIV